MKKRLIFSSDVGNCINLGVVDRMLRLFLGLAFLAYLYISHYLLDITDLSLVLSLMSIYPVLTALAAWDPIYQFFDINTIKAHRKDLEAENSNPRPKDKPLNNKLKGPHVGKHAA